MSAASTPTHLKPSELGTKEYWNRLYTNEITNHEHDPTDEGTVWFDDSDAEAKVVEFLGSLCPPASTSSPRSDDDENGESGREEEDGLEKRRGTGEGSDVTALDQNTTSFLDLGTGNGALLFGLRDAGWRGRMLGVDYSERSVELARRIAVSRRRRRERRSGEGGDGQQNGNKNGEGEDDAEEEERERGSDTAHTAEEQGDAPLEGEEEELLAVDFQQCDLLDPSSSSAILRAASQPRPQSHVEAGASRKVGWDVVLDKGTFDAISLSSDLDPLTSRRISESYRPRVMDLVRDDGGLFVITSCNWTEDELRAWFVDDHHPGHDRRGRGDAQQRQRNGEVAEERGGKQWEFEVVGRVRYPTFSFGGIKGQTISTLCFRKVAG